MDSIKIKIHTSVVKVKDGWVYQVQMPMKTSWLSSDGELIQEPPDATIYRMNKEQLI